jgi:hypothetical protein
MREDIRGAQIFLALMPAATAAVLSISGRTDCRCADIFSGALPAALLRNSTQSGLPASNINHDEAS